MKILLVNYRYFFSGGPERYYFNIKEVLECHGHEVIPFSVQSVRNEPNDYEEYFLHAIDDNVYFAQSNKKDPRILFKSFTRMFYSFEAKRKFKKLLRDTRPDIVYAIQFHNKISPSILDAAKEMGVPVVHRISDFQYICPNALFYNERKGLCEDCLKGKSWHCVKYKCVLDSTVYSAIKLAARKFHDAMDVTDKVDAFVVPSSFTLGKLREYGIPSTKLHHIPTFFNLQDGTAPDVEYQPFMLFVGRIEKAKGLMTLAQAFVDSGYHLKVIGFSNDGYDEKVKAFLQGKRHHVEFLGRKSFDEIVPYLRSCLCTVVPSEWYDNFPNVILESFAYKKAVIATHVGSLPELVRDGETGLTFRYADAQDLRRQVDYLFQQVDEAREMGEKAFHEVVSKYSPEVHERRLMALFRQVTS
ncbi:MAG: glycosyltransferase family 4 protein [Prevotella sp.]|nr:glycosyltransferase family 4 protein [Prevotella sp.]